MMNLCRQAAKINLPSLQQQSSQLQHVRTKVHVTVLKRKTPVIPPKKGFTQPPLRSRHFVYEVVAHANEEKDQPLELILTQYVEGLGKKGEKVKVKRQYGYNQLLLPKLAVYATPENEELYSSAEAQMDADTFSSKEAPRTMSFITKRVFEISMNKDEPWTIEPWHIRMSARKAGVVIKSDSCVELPATKISGPDMSLEGKEFYATIIINQKERVKVRCRLHHWSTEPGDRIQELSPWLKPAECIFPEQAEALKAIPLPVFVPKVKEIPEYK